MDNAIFSQAVNELFPEADEQTRTEIIERVTGHICEFIKKRVHENDNFYLDDLNKRFLNSPNHNNTIAYDKQNIFAQLSFLPEEIQQKISQDVNQELTRVMHQLYLAYIGAA